MPMILFAVLVVLFTKPAQEAKWTLVVQHAIADRALQEGQYKDARSAFLRAHRADPENATLMYGLACACLRLGQKTDALRFLKHATELGFQNAAMANRDRDLSKIQYDPRFQAMLPKPDAPQNGAARWRFTGSVWGAVARGWEADWLAIAPAFGQIHILAAATGEERFAVMPGAAPTVALAASPEGDLLASLDADGRLALIDPAKGELMLADAVPDGAGDGWPARLAFAAEGQRILATTVAGLAAWSCDGEFLRIIEPAGKGGRASWRLWDGSTAALAIEVDDRSVHLHDVAASGPAFRTMDFEQKVLTAALAVDGSLMAVGTAFGGLHVVDVATGSTLWGATVTNYLSGQATDIFGSPVSVSTLAFDPAGARLAICTASSYLVSVFDVASGDVLWRSQHLGGRMGTPMPLALGASVLVGDGGRFFWNAATGEALRHPLAIPAVVQPCGPDGLMSRTKDALEFLDGTTGRRLWRSDLVSGPARPFEHPSGWVWGTTINLRNDLEPWSFDPKRIRMAFEGMALLPPPVRALVKTREGNSAARSPVGTLAPKLQGQDYSGNPMGLSDFFGKVTVLEFSSRSSPLSRARSRGAEAFLAKHASDPVAWVGVSSDTKESVSAVGASWPTFYDGGTARGPISTAWGVTSWPTIFVIDHEGVLRHSGVSIARVESVVGALLKRINK